VPKNSLVAK